MNRLDGKVALITGAAQGMGASHAKKFIEEGAKVILTDLNEEKGQVLAKELGENALFIMHDVTDEEQWIKVIKEAEEAFGPISVLVNNAGIIISNPIEKTSIEDYRKMVEINQVSVFLGVKSIIPSMKKAEKGSIVNISSINGFVAGIVGYTDSKFAVRGLTKVAAIELAHSNIRVNSVHPGVIATPMILQDDMKEVSEGYAEKIPLGRVAQPEEVSNLVLYLATDESSYSTGSEFIVDGGFTAQ